MKTYICAKCGTAFQAKTREGNLKFCSRACFVGHMREMQGTERQAVCKTCGKTWTIYTNKRTPRYCSDTCKLNIVARFWARVHKSDGCWEWQGTITHGYGALTFGSSRNERAHRISWQITHGPIPDGLLVCHKCDNPRCVRPDHLFLGTPKDNTQDMMHKGRQRFLSGDEHPYRRGRRAASGERHSQAKLTWEKVREIRARHAVGNTTYSALAHEYQMSPQSISDIVHNRYWRES